jgi:hypothetical protein
MMDAPSLDLSEGGPRELRSGSFTMESSLKFKNLSLIAALCVVLALAMISNVSAVEVGEKAPDFELPSTQGGKLKLSSFQGKKNVVIEFYVLDFTPT